MAKGYELEGTVNLIEEVQEFKSGFTKREFVVEAQDGQYSQMIKFECVKDKTALLDGVSKGDKVNVFFDIRGNEYNGRYYVNLNAWKIEKGGASSAPPAAAASGDAIPFVDDGGQAPPSHEREAPPGATSETEDDIPF
jgi:single-strand DNA-binding protein